MTRQKIVAGNWKMHGSRAFTHDLIAAVAEAPVPAGCTVLVCPPFPFLATAHAATQGTAIGLGAQDLAAEAGQGAFTGEVSGAMLADVGVRYVLVGHSERRSLYGETDDLVAAKFAAARHAGLTPILCVGESRAEREGGETESVLGRQLGAVLGRVGVEGLAGAILAYEPVWAIGTGLVASPEQAQAAHAFLRRRVAARDATIADRLPILYGGSVKPDNARGLFALADVDGGLIGGAALKAADFAAIVAAAG